MEPIYAGTAQYNLIYIFAIHDEAHANYLKIGMTSFSSPSSYKQLSPNCEELNQNARMRINQYTKTALVHYELLHTELARKQVHLADGTIEATAFQDRDVHEVLDRSGVDRHNFYDTEKPSEWFKVDLQTAIAAIQAVKAGRNTLTAQELAGGREEQQSFFAQSEPQKKIILREEQKACVERTRTVFKTQGRMLWDCKMRFGKTLTAYHLVKAANYQKVLVVTHRPAVLDGWETDFHKTFSDNREFLYKAHMEQEDRFTQEDAGIDAENDRVLQNLCAQKIPFVYFASMQDLRGSKIVGGKFEKNRSVFAMDWDLIIYDEAHEGTQTELGQKVQTHLESPKPGKQPPKVLQLSGTPYNIYKQYDASNTYPWTYVQEQRAKRTWDDRHPGDYNPYADLPELRICTFDLREKMETSYRYEDETAAFHFREFFRTWTGDPKRDFRPLPHGAKIGSFVHAEDVRKFLDLITEDSQESHYPFATPEYREMFRHTFWILPGVKEARAFSAMLKEHPVFREYEVVNVAGEGDVEQPYDDALKAVRKAIHSHEKTITLSCGKLTTGVTVEQWTGVMLLSGSANTQASGYMQTIFRVQSAGSIDGKQKTVCYAFDFAPDRALKVLTEVHNLKKSATGSDEDGRAQLGEFLNFCPVLSESGTGMEKYDVDRMMTQLKHLTVEAAVKSGFDDDSIYRADAGIVMDEKKITLINLLKSRFSPQKKSKKQDTVTVNRQGLTAEQYKKAQKAKQKKKKDRTKEENELLKKEREERKRQKGLFDLLRNISIRLPLLIYGTADQFDDTVDLESFITDVDDASWKEFMPQELTKPLFQKLLVFYDEDVIAEAGKRIRRMARAADEWMPTQRVQRIAEIFSCFRNPAKETVLTPWRVVNMHMGDTIGGYNFYAEGYPEKDGVLPEPRLVEQEEVTAELFLNENVRVLEMNSKSGLYPLYVAYTIYRFMLPKPEYQMELEEARELWNRVLQEHLFVLCQTKMAVSITQRTLVGYTGHSANVIFLSKLLERMKDPHKLTNKLTNPNTWNREGERMKFDAIVGNPPYQLETGSTSRQATPIYNLFVNQAKALSPQFLSMIMPSRWFAGGMGLDDFRNEMMHDKHIRKIVDYVNAKDCFPQISISGGICYFLRDLKYEGDCCFTSVYRGNQNVANRPMDEFDVLVRYNEAVFSLRKVLKNNFHAITDIISPLMPFGLPTNLRGYESKKNDSDLLLHSSSGTSYIERQLVTKGSELIGKYKVLMSKTSAEHAGEPSKTGDFKVFTSSMKVIGPGEVCTHSYFLIGAFESKVEAENLLQYLKTKFVRFLVMLSLSAINLSKLVFSFVPMQDFSKSWTDEELYKKYQFTKEEIEFIESMIKPMEFDGPEPEEAAPAK